MSPFQRLHLFSVSASVTFSASHSAGTEVVFNGQQLRAIPIRDRLRLEGSVTIHYLEHRRELSGSENKDQKLVLLPSNDTTIKNIWAEAKLTRPDAIERGGPADASAVSPRQ